MRPIGLRSIASLGRSGLPCSIIFRDPTGEVGVARRDRVGANDLDRLWKREVGHVVDDHRLGGSARSSDEVSLSSRDT